MINLGFGTFIALLLLGLVAAFGYYRGFMAILTRKATFTEQRILSGWQAIVIGLVQFAGAAVASGLAFLLYFSLAR